MAEPILASASSPMKIDRKLFAKRLQAFKEEPSQQKANVFAFGMKVLENTKTRHHPTLLSFKDVGEIPIPISKEDSQRLKAVSQPIRKGLWEMDLQSSVMNKDNPHVAKYLDKTIPMMVDLTLRNLQLNREQLEGFQVIPHKLTIAEPGTGILVQQPTINSPGVFATLIVQLPFQGGHQGGLIKMLRGKLMRTFENALESSCLFYYTAFVSNTTVEMAELSSGSMVTITFHLVCSNPPCTTLSPTKLKEVASILLQLSPTGPDRLLAIPLDSNEVSFSALSPGNRRLFDLFKNMNFLEIRLATVCHYLIRTNQSKGCKCCEQRKIPCDKAGVQQIYEEKISTVKWLDTSDKDLQFENLNVNTRTEIVGDGPVFFDTPTVENTDPQTGLLHQWFRRNMLVIWHKERSAQLDCIHRFDVLLRNLEIGAQSTDRREEILRSLNEVIRFCKEFQEMILKRDLSQLLKLCLQLKANKETVDVLEILALKEGIRNEWMADLLAEVVKSIGWDLCANSILKLVGSSRAQEQMIYYVRFNSALFHAGCRKAAVAVASQIYTFLSSGNLITELEIPAVALCVDLMMIMDESPLTKHPQRLTNLSVHIKEKLPDFLRLLQLLILVQHYLDARPAENIPDTAISWFYNVSIYLAGMAIPSKTQPDAILSALKLFVSLGDSTIVQAFKNHLSSDVNQSNGILRSLIAAEEFWNFAQISSENKEVVASLVDKRIQWLIPIPKATATWEIPNASVNDHPIVENFMRSNERSMTYQNFNNIQHARNWMRKHYHEIAPYAEMDVRGAGRGAFCTIDKIKQRYVGEDAKRAICRKELMELIDRRLTRLGDTICSVVKDQNTDEISSVEVVHQSTTTETISTPVQSTPAVAATPKLVSNPVVLNRVGTHAVPVFSNVQQQPAKKTAAKVKKSTVKRIVTPPKVAQPVFNPAVEIAAKKKLVKTRKTSPANILSVRQVNQQPLTSSQPSKSPVDSKSSITFQTLLPSNVPSPKTTPRRVGVAKRPLVMASFSQFNTNPSLASNNPAIDVKEESASKRAKLEMA